MIVFFCAVWLTCCTIPFLIMSQHLIYNLLVLMFLGNKSQEINATILSFWTKVKTLCCSNFFFFCLPAIVIVNIALARFYSHLSNAGVSRNKDMTTAIVHLISVSLFNWAFSLYIVNLIPNAICRLRSSPISWAASRNFLLT